MRSFLANGLIESDIRGGNSFQSPNETDWRTILVKTGVYQTGKPAWEPNHIAADVFSAVQYALQKESWPTAIDTQAAAS
jgi:ribonucleotide monophosphatase NagD (HAD superfamily)